MSAHTPAPWDVAPNWPDGMTCVCRHDGKGWHSVAHTNRTTLPQAEQVANARLIAAAPDLLDALRVLVECGGIGPEEMFHDARAAIAKAEAT
jgi:hypothetical protein